MWALKRLHEKKWCESLHDRFIRDETFRKNMLDNGRTDEFCRQMDDLADEDHTHHLTPEEIDDYSRSNKIGANTMPIRTNLTSRKHCPPCDSSKTKKLSSSQPKIVAKLFFVLVELARIMVAFFSRITTKTYPTPINQGNLINVVIGTLLRGMIFRIHLLFTDGSFIADGGLL